MTGEDKRLFIAFVKRMLRWMPEDRATAAELLEDPWLTTCPVAETPKEKMMSAMEQKPLYSASNTVYSVQIRRHKRNRRAIPRKVGAR